LSRGKKFVVNVVWNWLGVLVSLFIGFFISPYLIRKLGPEAYGIWSLTFALVEYYWFFDLGFRSATTKYVAHYHATGEPDKVREIINTGLFYLILVAAGILVLLAIVLPWIQAFFHIPEAWQGGFRVLVWMITVNWCMSLVFNLLTGTIEAVQRFDTSNRITITAATVRAVATFTVLYLGYGLIAVGAAVFLGQFVGYIAAWFCFRRIFPDQRLSPRYANRRTLRMMWNFGRHTFVSAIGMQAQTQSAPVLIGHFLPTDFVGYFNLPGKLLQYTVDFVGRIGAVTNSNTAELAARGEFETLSRLAVYVNRYSLVIFMPLAVLLLTHGDRFFVLWVGPEFAARSAPVLPILVVGYVIAIVGQYSASMLLQGLGKHKSYALGLVVESVVGIVLMLWIIPRNGIVGAAWVLSILMVLDRGIFVPIVVSRVTGIPYAKYMHGVYTWPLLTAIPALIFGWWLRASFLPGNGWLQIFAAGALIGVVYYALSAALSVEREHRALLLDWLGHRFRRAEVKAV
jgi:O-antigen/teichoic acid export membrane protein